MRFFRDFGMKSEIWTFSSGSVWFSSFDIANPSLTSFPQRADGGVGVVGAAILVFGEVVVVLAVHRMLLIHAALLIRLLYYIHM